MTGKKPAQFALLVHACDRYSFLYQGFEYFFNKYWDFSIPCNYYFATEELTTEMAGFKNIRSGKGEWSDRLAHLLRTEITEPYVIYFQEDMWLTKPISATFFAKLFQSIEANHWKQVKLTSAGVYQTVSTGETVDGFTLAILNNEHSGFLMSHQVTIWDKDFLLTQLPRNEHPWRNERRGTKRLKKLNPAIYQVDYFAENGHHWNNTNPDPSTRSEYFTVSQNSMLNERVLRYIEELQQAGDTERIYARDLQEHYDQQLTHDGLSKPRKEDVFKKIKNWLKRK